MKKRRISAALAILAVLLLAQQSGAQSLSTAQLAILKADIEADAELKLFPKDSDGAFAIALLYNLPAASDHWVWRTKVTKNELVTSVSVDATTFTWVGNGFITRTAGEQTAWRELFDKQDSVNPSLANVRQAFADIFSGAGNAAANRTHLLAVARRKATRFEKLFATGTGSTASPAVMSLEGPLLLTDVEAARNLP